MNGWREELGMHSEFTDSKMYLTGCALLASNLSLMQRSLVLKEKESLT